MRTAFGKNSRSFFAFLTILSVTFTQACPAFALRGMGADNPAVPAAIQAGLEEPDGGGAAVLDLPPVRSANLAQLTAYFSQSSEWQQVQGRSESEKASVLVGMFMDAIQDQAGTPPEIVLAMTDPAQYLPLALRLLVPGDTGLHQRVDSQWNDLEQQCALCAAHILHENLGETPRRDGAGHAAKDVLASIVTAIDTAKLGRIPTRPVRPARGHGEREVVTQTAYSVSVVGGLTVFQAPSPEEMMRAIADVVPSTPSNEEPVSLPVIHVRALGSPNSAPANHYVAVEAVNFSSNRVHVLDNGEARVMPVAQFIRQYRPTGLLFLSPEQTDLVQSAGFQFQSPTEQQLLGWTGDCGTCAIKGHFPAGYHAPIDWALVSAGRLLYRGADGGTVQVRYRVDGGEPVIRSYRVAYNSTTQELTFRVAEIGQDQKEAVLHQEDFSILEATERFKRKPSEIKRYMAKLLADLAHQAEFRIPVTATILDVVTHFRWATHGPSDIRGTHPHQARPEEVGTPTEPVAKTVTVAHNGIIYDYIELGIQLTAAGHTFESGVDSERFAHLVWEIIQTERPESLLEAVRRAMGRISMNDTYGFQIISNDYPDELVSARNESPIYLGIGETGVDSGAVPFFITAADPKAILPHTGIYSATLLPNRTVVQVKNDAMTVLNPDGLPYVLVMPNGSLTYGHRNDGQMVPAQVFVQQVDKSGNPLEAAPRSVSSLTRDEMKQYNEGKLRLRVSAFDGGQPGPAQAGFIVFQKGVDNPSVYDLGDFPDYTTKELYQSGRGMRDTIAKNTVQVPVYYIPREVSVGAGFVRSYRAANLRTRNNAQDISLTAEQAASIAGPQEWTELVHLPDGRQVFLKRVPSRDVQTPMYDQLDLPEFPRIPSWDQLRDIDEVWGVSVGSSYNSDLDGFEYIRRYSGRGVRMLNSDDLRDDQHWMNDASGKKRIAVIATTQSGTTAVTKANMEKITAASGKPEAFGVEFLTIADTNTPGSDITKPEYTQMEMNEGLPPEIGVLSTAAVHSQKVNKELFGMRLGVERRFLRPEEAHDRIEQLKTISHEVDGVLASSDAERDLREVAEEMVRTNQAIAGYRGLARGAASEMTIKLQEGGEINMITFNMGSFLHGPAQLLQFSKVPVGTEATAEARYDTASAAIVASTVYRNPQGGSELRGFPIIVHYIPEEGDDGARGRLESNFQQVASRGASVYVFTSPEYAADLQGKTTEVPQANGEKKSTSLVRRAFGYPANPYTLTALGQKLALMVAELKNTSMADKLFERARSINEAQVENVPVEFSSREEWVRQRLVDAYAEVVRFRENGWLSQVLFEEGVGSVLSKIDAAARTPGDRFLVDDARDSVARVVSYIDVAQPGKLAKSVTVETGLEEGIQSFEKTQQQVVQFVRGSVSVLRSVDDSRVDSELLDRVRPWLEERGVRPEVRYGDPLGRSVRLQASGPDSRPLFQLTSLDGRPLFLAPAYENQPQQPIQRRVLLVSLRANIRSGHQYWVFPVDEHLQERLGILIGQFVAAGPGAALSERVRQVQGFLSGRVRSAADLPRLLKAYQGLEQEPSGAFFLEDQESDNLVFLVGAFPYRSVPEGAELNIALIDGIRQVEERLSTKLHASRLFVAEFHGEPSVAFFQVAFRRSALQGVAVDLIAEAKQVARPYSAVSPPSEAASARAVGLLPVVPSDFLPEFKVNFERRVGTAVLGQVFGLVEGVFQGGPPQVLVVTDQLDGGSVVWVITGDREGLNRDIGGALAGLGINIDQQVTDTYLPATAPSGQPRVAVSFSSITQPVDVVQSMGVATALESVLGARPVVSEALPSVGEFRRAVVEDLGPLRLPDAGALGTLANQAGLLFEAYAGTGRPQAQAFPYPGDPSRSIVIALDADLSALGLDVFIPIRREAEATVANTDGTKVGGVSFLILVVQDRSAAQIEPAVRRVRRRLEGARMPQAFADYMRDQGFLNRMPNGSLRSIWGKLAGLDDPNEPNEVIPSLNVPDSTSQTAVTFVVRQDAVPGLKERFLALVGEQELQVVPTQEDEPEDMLVETTYQKEGSPESRYLLRAVISASRDSDKVGTILTTIASEFHLHLASGLEETPESSQSQSPLDLVLPDRWPSFDAVVKRLNEALTSSSFLKTVRENLRQTEGVLPGYRPIVKAESDALEKNGVVAENWRNVYVPVDGLSTGDAKRMQGLRLLGTVYLGHLKGDVKLSSGKTVPSEIRNSVLRDVVIGNNVLIRDNILVERYVIGDGAVVTQNRELTAERGTDFGMGKPIPIGPETGGREIKAYPEILLGDVVRLARFQGDKAGQAAYAEALAKYLEAAKADYGYIGRGAEVSAVADGKNLFVADGGVVFDNTIVHNLLLLTAESERSVVVGTSEVVNLIAQPGVEINGANVVMGVDDGAHGVLMLEHSHAGNGATVKDSVIAPNTGVEKGESTSSFLGPFIGMHHNSLVIAVDWAAGMGNVGAGVLDGSNHPGRAPDQEEQNGEGTFLGLGSMYSFSGNYADSPYTMFGKGVSMLPSRMAMPFSLVQKPTVQIPGESPEFMEINPAWGWSDNAYMPMRNEGKYASRDKSSRNGLKATGNEDPLLRRIPFEILRPDTVNQMIRARDVLAKVDLATAKKVKFEGDKETILYYTGPKSEKKVQPGEIPELGKTFMRESSRDKAVKTYTAMIQYYGAKGLWAEIQKLAAADRLSEVPALLSTPSVDLRWEHERRVLLTELPGKTVPDILRFLVESQERLAKQVRTSKEKDDERGERILDDYGETHTIAANDKFVKQSAAAAAKLRSDVEALLPQLATGVEEVEVLAAELQRGLPNIQIPAAPSTTATIVDLTVDENGRANPAAALIVPYLPVGTVAIVRSMDDLMTAEQLAGRTTQAAVVFIGERDFEFVLVEALRAVLPGAGVQLLSGRSEGEIRRALAVASRRDASLPKVAEIMAPKALAAILDALGVDEATRTAFMTLFQRAQDNWDGLVQYL